MTRGGFIFSRVAVWLRMAGARKQTLCPHMTSSARIAVYVQPRASLTELAGLHDGCIKIRLAAPPVDGAANAALIAFVAERLGIAKQHVRLVSGHGSRRKVLEIEGLSLADIHGALDGA